MSTPISVTAFAARQKELLDAELAAEVASTSSLTATSSPKQLSRSGLAIINLVISAQRTGLGGKNVLELESDAATQSTDSQGNLGEHGIRVGDIVSVSSQPKGNERKAEKAELENKGVTGVVTKVLTRTIHVALDNDDGLDGLGERLWVLKMANDITYKRMKWVMNEMEKGGDEGQTQLMRICFGHSQPTDPQLDSSKTDLTFQNPNLNDSQKEAIRFALASLELALIHGPPGTGKTYTVVELILQLIQQQKRVLVCGPSNISVDNIVERLAPYKVPIVRVGHPARLLPAVLDHSLEMLIHRSDAAEIVQDIRNEIDQKAASIKKTRNGRERRAIYSEMKDLRKEFQVRERKCTDELVRSSKVVLSTLHGSGGSQLRNQVFDVVIIDEASQALEAQCWVALFKAKKVILAGDHLQLGPTIMSSKSKSGKTAALPIRTKTKPNDSIGKDDPVQAKEFKSKPEAALKSIVLETTLFDRLPKLYGSTVMRMLTTQYRMHESIMRFPSDQLYEGRLVAADSVKSRLLTGLPYEVHENDDTKEPLIYYDTDGGDFPERDDDEPSGSGSSRSTMLSDSKLNENEAALVHTHLAALIEAGVKATDIAIVTPYNAQRGLLTRSLRDRYPGLEIGSVDGFQGREKEAVIVSLVRSNDEKESGFVGDQRRLNVLMTRPKRQLCVIGDGETISKGGKFAKAWIEHLRDKADLRYPDVSELSDL